MWRGAIVVSTRSDAARATTGPRPPRLRRAAFAITYWLASRSSEGAKAGAGEGNRTLVVSLEGFCSTIELHPLERQAM